MKQQVNLEGILIKDHKISYQKTTKIVHEYSDGILTLALVEDENENVTLPELPELFFKFKMTPYGKRMMKKVTASGEDWLGLYQDSVMRILEEIRGGENI